MRRRKNIKQIILILITCAWMVFIFCMSAAPADDSSEMSLDVGMAIGTVFVPEFDSMSEQEQHAFAEKIDHPVRKAAHATEYAVLGALLSADFEIWRRRKSSGFTSSRRLQQAESGHVPNGKKKRFAALRNIGLPLLISFGYACTDEFHQLFVPGRSGQFTDVLIDTCGAFCGILLWLLVRHLQDALHRKHVSVSAK